MAQYSVLERQKQNRLIWVIEKLKLQLLLTHKACMLQVDLLMLDGHSSNFRCLVFFLSNLKLCSDLMLSTFRFYNWGLLWLGGKILKLSELTSVLSRNKNISHRNDSRFLLRIILIFTKIFSQSNIEIFPMNVI